MRKSQFVSFDNGLVESLETLAFKQKTREEDSEIKTLIIDHWANLDRIGETINQNTYHKVAIETVSIDVSSNGFEIEDNDNEEDSDIQKNIKKFFNNLNVLDIAYELSFEFRLYGQAWLEVLRKDYDSKSEIKKLNVLQAKYMYIDAKDERVFRQMVNGKIIFFKNGDYINAGDIDVNYKTGEVKNRGQIPKELRASEVFYIKTYNPDSNYYGFPIALNIMSVIIGDLKRGENNLNFFLRGGVPKYLITISGNFDNMINRLEYEQNPEEVVPVYIEEWLEGEMNQLEKQNNPNSSMVLTLQNNGQEIPIDVQFKEISSTTGEASHTQYRKDNRDEILSAHQVPSYRLGIAETGSLGQTNIIEQNKIYNRKVVKPLQTKIETIMNKILLSEYGTVLADRFSFKFNEIDLEDSLSKLDAEIKQNEFYLKELQAGVIDTEYYYELTGKDFKMFENSLDEQMLDQEVIEEISNKAKGIL